MGSTLRVRVPGPAGFWSLAVDGVDHPVDGQVPVAAGRAVVALQAAVPVPSGQGTVRLECVVDVPEDGQVVLSLPLADVPLPDLEHLLGGMTA